MECVEIRQSSRGHGAYGSRQTASRDVYGEGRGSEAGLELYNARSRGHGAYGSRQTASRDVYGEGVGSEAGLELYNARSKGAELNVLLSK